MAVILLAMVGSLTAYFLREPQPGAGVDPDLDKGMVVGKQKLDSLRIIPYGFVSAGSDTVNSRYIRRWYVTTDVIAAHKTVELLISWPLTGRHTITFNTVVGDDRYKVY